MDANDFSENIEALALSRPAAARLMGVTVRAVNMWCSGDREIPGPATAYLRLLRSLPRALQVAELAKLEAKPMSYDGLYLVEFEGAAGTGLAALVFMNGIVFGHDGGVRYDGTYEPSAHQPGFMDVRLNLVVPPGVELVMGVPAQPAEYNFDINVRLPARGHMPLTTDTPYGQVAFQIRYLRPIPENLAA